MSNRVKEYQDVIGEKEQQLAEAQALLQEVVKEVDNNPDIGCPTSGELWDKVCEYVEGGGA